MNRHFDVLLQSLKMNQIRHPKRLCRVYPKCLDKFRNELHTAKQGKRFCIYICRQVQPNELLNHSTDDINTNPKDSMQDNNPRPHNHVTFNPLNPELNPICYLLALLAAHHFLHVSRIRFKLLTFRLLMSYIYIWSTHS